MEKGLTLIRACLFKEQKDFVITCVDKTHAWDTCGKSFSCFLHGFFKEGVKRCVHVFKDGFSVSHVNGDDKGIFKVKGFELLFFISFHEFVHFTKTQEALFRRQINGFTICNEDVIGI